MNKSFLSRLVLAGSLLLLWSPLQSQTKSLDTIQDIQLTANEFCAVIEVNASWNWANKIPLEKLENCYTAYVDLSNKQIGAIIQNEWDITVVPTIIIFEYGKEVKRFEADLSMKFREDEILNAIRKEIRK
jgi:hypothetical protein